MLRSFRLLSLKSLGKQADDDQAAALGLLEQVSKDFDLFHREPYLL
jgi:hypothetical protein